MKRVEGGWIYGPDEKLPPPTRNPDTGGDGLPV
jgi:hypothetical protein